MSKLRPIVLLAIAAIALSGCLVIQTERRHTDTVQAPRP